MTANLFGKLLKVLMCLKFFSTIGSELASRIPQDIHFELNENIFQVTPTADKITVDRRLFTKAFNNTVREGKSCGPDGITANDLLLDRNSPVQSIYPVFIKSVERESFPKNWKKSKVSIKRDKKGLRRSAETTAQFPFCPFQAK